MPGATKPRKKSRSAKTAWVDVESDPTGRFTRSNQVLGRGASKVVYKGFDRHQGIEVAWNQVKIVEHLTAKEHARLESEVAVLRRLKHRNIMSFYASWIDNQQHTLNFVTEYFHPGPLRRHRRNHKHLSRRVLKRWAWQILEGLIYLHGHMPPIIHRDLKCDNIFIHGTTGSVKIGDLGLAKLMEEGLSTCQSVLGTPEFMAPELYREKYNEKVDIYSFGMCLLELVTMEFPYKECKNKAQIFRQVTLGVYPAALSRIEDVETRSFIELCIDHFHEKRPLARQLIKHPFFDDIRPDKPSTPFPTISLGSESGRDSAFDDSAAADTSGQSAGQDFLSRPPSAPLPSTMSEPRLNTESQESPLYRRASAPVSGPHNSQSGSSFGGTAEDRSFTVQQRGADGSVLDFELCMTKVNGGSYRRFKFTFDVEMDTVQAVADEFEEEFGLTLAERDHFVELMQQELSSTAPKERFVAVEQRSSVTNSTVGTASRDAQLSARSRKFTPRASPRIVPHPDNDLLTGQPSNRKPLSPVPRSTRKSSPTQPYSETEGAESRGSSGESQDKGVVLMRVSGNHVAPQRPRRPIQSRSQQPQPLSQCMAEGMDGMGTRRTSPERTETNEFSGSLKAYRGGSSQQSSRSPTLGRSVSPDPQERWSGGRQDSYQHDQIDHYGRTPHTGQERGGPVNDDAPAYQQNWGYQNHPAAQEHQWNDDHRGRQGAQPSGPGPYTPQAAGQQSWAPIGNTLERTQYPPPQRQERWTEPGFHMPTCGPFPTLSKLKSLFSK